MCRGARMARGIDRLGLPVSSPSVAAPSNPAKERNPKTLARATAEKPAFGIWNGTVERPCAPPRPRMTTASTRISSTDNPSITSVVRVEILTSRWARNQIRPAATSAGKIQWMFTLIKPRKVWKKRPTSAVEAMVKPVYVSSSAQADRKPILAPNDLPLKTYTEPAWANWRLDSMNGNEVRLMVRPAPGYGRATAG